MHFNLSIIQWIAEHRNPLLTHFFTLCSFVGDVNGYILIITLVYVMWDKRLAMRLAILVLFTSSLNHFLKIIIRNPRPFVKRGTYLKEWAIPRADAQSLATEYSTPSGHAMAAGAFYTCLYSFANSRLIKFFAVFAIISIGVSRPYLGVHYIEDILIGWTLGLLIALSFLKYAERLEELWTKVHYKHQVVIAFSVSLLLCVVSIAINNWHIDSQQRAFAGYAGFLSGILVAYPLEIHFVNFNPKQSHWSAKGLRYMISISLVIATLFLLDKAFAQFSSRLSLPGFTLEYVRYAIAGFVSMLVAPILFTLVGLAEKAAKE